jgi:hypothetical protein
MNPIYVTGVGAVSPAGWGAPSLYAALESGAPIPTRELSRPGWERPLQARSVPPPPGRMEMFAHPRLRRVSLLTQHTAAAGLEALGPDAVEVRAGRLRLGIVVCLLAGCVTYSRRFFEEALQDPRTASPMLFPETVYNAPASHLGAFLGATGMSYTLVGDEVSFLEALSLAAGWMLGDQVDACLVIAGEELDWISADATRLFNRRVVNGAGAGALYLRKDAPARALAELAAVTEPVSPRSGHSLTEAARQVRRQLPGEQSSELLCLSAGGSRQTDLSEEVAWHDWTGPRFAPKRVLGEAFNAAAAWQCVAACEGIQRGLAPAANVSILSASHQAIGARFTKCRPVATLA